MRLINHLKYLNPFLKEENKLWSPAMNFSNLVSNFSEAKKYVLTYYFQASIDTLKKNKLIHV